MNSTKIRYYIFVEIIVAIFTVILLCFWAGLSEGILLSISVLLLQLFVTFIFSTFLLPDMHKYLSLLEDVLYRIVICLASAIVIYCKPEVSISIKTLLIVLFYLSYIFMIVMCKYCRPKQKENIADENNTD